MKDTVIKCYNQDELFDVCLSLNVVPRDGLFHFKGDVVGVRISDKKIALWFWIWKKGMKLITATEYLKTTSCLH